MGLRVQGDIGPYTCYYNSRGKLVVFPKSPPEKEASRYQAILRNKFRRIAIEWGNLTHQDQDQWELCSKKARLGCHGYDLFTYASFPGKQLSVATIWRQAGLTPP